ncbi:MAG: hypothetical protein QG665_325 [Patescibacteria group bacterium]|nr:hypothetical protein [Patescibacteria group bacterium]
MFSSAGRFVREVFSLTLSQRGISIAKDPQVFHPEFRLHDHPHEKRHVEQSLPVRPPRANKLWWFERD